MADPLNLVPSLRAGVTLQAIDDDVLVLSDDELTRLTGLLAKTIRDVEARRGIRAVGAVDELVSRGFLELADGGPEPRYRRPDHIGMSEDPDVLVLLDLRTGARPVLGSPAAEVWRLLVATGSVQATVAELELDFPDAPSLAEDTAEFVAELEAQGLVDRVG